VLFDKSASDLYSVICTKQNERIFQIRSKYTMEMSIFQAENGFSLDELVKRRGCQNTFEVEPPIYKHFL